MNQINCIIANCLNTNEEPRMSATKKEICKNDVTGYMNDTIIMSLFILLTRNGYIDISKFNER